MLCVSLLQKHCIGWGILSLRLVNYKNPGHTLFNGECCDTLTWCSTNACENYFKFCVTSLGSLHPCNLGSSETRVLGDDDFTFPKVGGSLGTNLLNPLTFNFSHWQVSIFKPLFLVCVEQLFIEGSVNSRWNWWTHCFGVNTRVLTDPVSRASFLLLNFGVLENDSAGIE